MYMVSVATTRFYHCSSKGTILKKKKKTTSKCGWVPIKLYQQKQALGQI